MDNYRFTILGDIDCNVIAVPYEDGLRDHEAVLQAYFRTFEKRGFVEESLKRVKEFLKSVFERILVQDGPDATASRHLLIWDLLKPIVGSEVVDLFATSLNRYDYSHTTRLKYLGDIRRLCEFVLSKPYIPGRVPESIVEKYGSPCQPFSRYDYPVHAVDNPRLDPALTGADLRLFLEFLRVQFINEKQNQHIAERDYAMIILGVSAGLRADELVNLDLDDLRYSENRVWIRFGKGHKGSGKRQRLTVFTKFAQATLRVYEAHTRMQFGKASSLGPALFLSEQGGRISYDSMRLALAQIVEAARKAGIKLPSPFGWHDLRRSFATDYLERRPDRILHLAGYMGHTGLGTLHRYVRPGREAFQRATDALLDTTLPAPSNSEEEE